MSSRNLLFSWLKKPCCLLGAWLHGMSTPALWSSSCPFSGPILTTSHLYCIEWTQYSRPHKGRVEENSHLSLPYGRPSSDAAFLPTVGPPGCRRTLLSHAQIFIHQNPPFLLQTWKKRYIFSPTNLNRTPAYFSPLSNFPKELTLMYIVSGCGKWYGNQFF